MKFFTHIDFEDLICGILSGIAISSVLIMIIVVANSENSGKTSEYVVEENVERCFLVDKFISNIDGNDQYIIVFKNDDGVHTIESKDYYNDVEVQNYYFTKIRKLYEINGKKKKVVNEKILSILY